MLRAEIEKCKSRQPVEREWASSSSLSAARAGGHSQKLLGKIPTPPTQEGVCNRAFTRPCAGLETCAHQKCHPARVELVAINTPKQVLFIMPTDASGAYHVRVRRRHLRPDGPLLKGGLSGPIRKTAASPGPQS